MRQHVHAQASAGAKPDGIARQPAAPAQTHTYAPPARVLDFDFTSLPAQAPIRIQPKLTIGQTDDPLEREADRVADDAMRMPEQTAIAHSTRASPSNAGLDAGTRAFFEPRMRFDFSSVRVHADSRAAESAAAIGAKAFTAGRDIFFGRGNYDPGSKAGKHLIGHELAHVVQQSRTGAMIQRQPEGGGDPEKDLLDAIHKRLKGRSPLPEFSLSSRQSGGNGGLNIDPGETFEKSVHPHAKKKKPYLQLPEDSAISKPSPTLDLPGKGFSESNFPRDVNNKTKPKSMLTANKQPPINASATGTKGEEKSQPIKLILLHNATTELMVTLKKDADDGPEAGERLTIYFDAEIADIFSEKSIRDAVMKLGQTLTIGATLKIPLDKLMHPKH